MTRTTATCARAALASQLVVMLAAVLTATAVNAAPDSSREARSERIITEDDRKHWSYLPLQRPLLPAVKHAAFVRTPVDRFILARLEANKLGPSRLADPRRLVRRIYFDLLGLPPTTAQVETFV